jgi:hypothetical protein
MRHAADCLCASSPDSLAGNHHYGYVSAAVVFCRHSLTDHEGRLMLKNLTYSQLEEWCVAAGAPHSHDHNRWRRQPQQLLRCRSCITLLPSSSLRSEDTVSAFDLPLLRKADKTI